jgi:hypothetical protein
MQDEYPKCPEELMGTLDQYEILRCLLTCIGERVGVTPQDIYAMAAKIVAGRGEPTEGS